MTIAISTSDRKEFKRCRRAHGWSSPLGRYLKPDLSRPHLSFGTAIHAGLEYFYNTKNNHDYLTQYSGPRAQEVRQDHDPNSDPQRLVEMKAAFLNSLKGETEFWEDLYQLGLAMLENYYTWALKVDNFSVQATEEIFTRRIPWRNDYDMDLHEVFSNRDGYLYCGDEAVVYKGTIDGLVRSYLDDRYYILEHKTTAVFGNLDFLAMDDQCTAYLWGYQNRNPYGVIYNELLKAEPMPIRRMKKPYQGRNFSTNRRHRVILKDFMHKLREEGEDLNLYTDYLEYLRINPQPFFKRSLVRRTPTELDNFERDMFYDVIDILDPRTVKYPTPNRMSCNMCAFYEPCNLMNRGDDYEFLLDQLFVQRRNFKYSSDGGEDETC